MLPVETITPSLVRDPHINFALGEAQFHFSRFAAGTGGQQQGNGQADPAQRPGKMFRHGGYSFGSIVPLSG